MGGGDSKCCKPDKEPGDLPLAPQSPYSAIKEGQIYVSSLPQVLSMSGNKLDATYMPLKRAYGKNSLILPVGGTFQPRLFVRFFLIYSFYIKKYIDEAPRQAYFQNLFYKLAAKTHTESEELAKLQQFQSEYKNQTNGLRKQLLVVKYIFSSKFIIENLNQILLNSDNPKDIGHLVFPLASAFNAIKKNYQDNRAANQKQIYIVAALEKQEMALIKQMRGRPCCFYFSTFMKGFTEDSASLAYLRKLKEQHKQTKATVSVMRFVVNFPYKFNQLDKSTDSGYYINPNPQPGEANVLFNIMNSFKVIDQRDNDYELEYGFLPTISSLDKNDRLKSPENMPLLRVIDICNAVSRHYLKSQSCLFRIIKQGEESIKVSQSFSEANTEASQKSRSKLPEIEVENIINNYIDMGNYEEAMKLATLYGTSDLMKAKQAVILYKQKKYSQAKEVLKKIPRVLSASINQATEIAEFIEAKLTMEEGQNKKAAGKLRKLMQWMKGKYGNQLEIIGIEVITALEEASGKKQVEEIDLRQAQPAILNKTAIDASALNMRGIATSI